MRFVAFPFILSIILLQNGFGRVDADGKTKSDKYTQEEITKFKKFREMTGSMTGKDYMKTDGYLIRWLRAGELNLDSATKMLGKAMKWRAQNNMSTILQEDFSQANSFTSITDAFDKYGRPVAQLEVKKMDSRKFIVGGNAKIFTRIWDQMYERMEEKIYKATTLSSGKDLHLGQGVVIMDLTDYNLRQHACIACIPVYLDNMRSYERNFPGLFGKVFLINAPRIFSPLLELMKPVMSSQTRDALTVFGTIKGDWEPKLHELISPEQLPIRFGGTKPKF